MSQTLVQQPRKQTQTVNNRKNQAADLLRDMAYVLHLTQSIKTEMLAEVPAVLRSVAGRDR